MFERSFFYCRAIEASDELGTSPATNRDRTPANQIVLVASGAVTVQLERTQREFAGPIILYAPQDFVRWFTLSTNAFGVIYDISHSFIEQIEPTDKVRGKFENPGYHFPSDIQVKVLLEIARHASGAQRRKNQTEMLKVFNLFSEAWVRLAVEAEFTSSIDEQGLAIRFRNLVGEYYTQHKPISFYTDRLNCTVRTLTRHTHDVFGMTPRQLINQRLMREAQHRLRVTSANCTVVARELGFDDPSYFSRVYRRTMGSNPSAEKTADIPNILEDPDRIVPAQSAI